MTPQTTRFDLQSRRLRPHRRPKKQTHHKHRIPNVAGFHFAPPLRATWCARNSKFCVGIRAAVALLPRCPKTDWGRNLSRILARSGKKKSTNTRKDVIELRDDRTKLQVDLQRADFNGDVSSPACLVCEFCNGERYSFYVLRNKCSYVGTRLPIRTLHMPFRRRHSVRAFSNCTTNTRRGS